MNQFLLRGAKVVLLDHELDTASVLVEEGRIAAITQDKSLGAALEIDVSNTTLLPGFIDIHIHGAAGVDVMDAAQEDLKAVSLFLSSQGVTGWVPTLVPASDENYAQAMNAIAIAMQKKDVVSARVLGIHYEGPFVNMAQCGALHKTHFKTYFEPSDLNRLRVPATGVKMITLAPEVDGGVDLVTELNRRGWVVSLGHTRADVKLLDRAFEKGARHMTHFMNAMAPLHHRSPGPIGWGLSRDDVTCDIIADGVHLDPSILRLLMKVKGARRVSLISDAIAAAGKGDGEYQIWGETITVTNGRTSNAAGSIAGSVITMLDAVRMMRSLGVSDVEIARMASTNPARLLKLDQECGSIEEGKRADLVAIDPTGRVKLTLVGGKIAFRK